MIYIVGPTSSGKTSLALKVCKKFNKEIISADSRQIYKHFDIGTGKLPVSVSDSGVLVERGSRFWTVDGVKIHMYDVCDAMTLYSVSDFLNDVRGLVGDNKIVVGGTGLYIDNLLGLKKPSPVPPNKELRAKLEKLPFHELQAMLPADILDSMNKSDINNPRRLIRRIEIQKYRSKHLNSDENNNSRNVIQFEEYPHVIVLDLPRDELFKRVDSWVDLIWIPLLSEVKDLFSQGYKGSFPMSGIIYKTAIDFTDGKVFELDAVQKVKNDLHAYIRRQQTWFNKYDQDFVHRFESADDAFLYIESILAY